MTKKLDPKAVLIDLAGVLHTGDAPITGSLEAMSQLRASGISLRFLTNTTRSPAGSIVKKLTDMGFDIKASELQTAVTATRSLIAARGLRPHYLVHPDIVDEIGPSSPTPDSVVLGDAGPFFTYAALNEAFRLLMQGLPLLVMAKNRYFMEADGLSLDMGAYVTGLEYSAGIKAEVIGKPAIPFFETALAELDVAPEDAVLIGDDLADDIGGAQDVGIPGILVRTGKFRTGDEHNSALRPTLIVNDFAEAVTRLLA